MEKVIPDTEKKPHLRPKKANIAAEQAKHSAEEANDSEKALPKLKLEAEHAKAIFTLRSIMMQLNKKSLI